MRTEGYGIGIGLAEGKHGLSWSQCVSATLLLGSMALTALGWQNGKEAPGFDTRRLPPGAGPVPVRVQDHVQEAQPASRARLQEPWRS